MRTVLSFGIALGLAVLLGSWLAVESRAQAPEKGSLAGSWTRNRELSDPAPARGMRGDDDGRGGDRGGRKGRGGFGGGGFGRGGGGGRGGDGRAGNANDIARRRDALRDIMQPGDHLTITQSDSMVVITDQDGRTTRLSPDGKKINDDNTHIERRSRWEGSTLVSDISGAGQGKITQTFSADPPAHQLRIVVQRDGGDNQKRSVTLVYDADPR